MTYELFNYAILVEQLSVVQAGKKNFIFVVIHNSHLAYDLEVLV